MIELRDPIHGPIAVSPGELAVIDSPAFQRLRGVKQLGFAEYVFPGAVHNRYLHSIGAMHLAGRAFDAIRPSLDLDEASAARLRQTVRLGALLHDVGHAPLSHAAEALMPLREDLGLTAYGVQHGRASHEDVSLKLIVDSPLTTTIDRTFAALGVTARDVAAALGCTAALDPGRFTVRGVDVRPCLEALLSGELDVDRMDYLLRDSYFTGARYGQYDLEWLMSSLSAVVVRGDGADAPERAHLALDGRAVPTFEHFLLARYHMFMLVYFHPKSDIYDAMLNRWLSSEGPEARFPADPERFVGCDDAWLMARLNASADPWARRVRDKKPYRLLIELDSAEAAERRDQLDAALRDAGIEPLWLRSQPVLSRYAQAPAHQRTNPLYVRSGRGQSPGRVMRIEEATDLFGRFDKTRRIERLYVAPERLAEARALVGT